MKKGNHYNSLIPVGMLLGITTITTITTITSMFLLSNHTMADSKTVNASVVVPEACTMTSTNDAPHTATLAPNTYSGASGSEYENGIGKTTMTVICNDDNGFSVYAIGYTGDSYDSENHTKLVGQNTNVAINTAVYTSSDTTSNWSMKVNKINDSTVSYNPQNMSILNSFDSWHIVPATYAKVAEYHANTGSSTTDTTLGVKLETTYAAYIAQNQPADTYIGQVKYTMVHPYNEEPLQPRTTQSGKICYYPNGNNVDGTMGCQTIPTSGTVDGVSSTSATLLASNFNRQGYGFAGWSNKFDYASNPTQEGIKFHGPQETITYEEGQYTSEKGLSLYAVWVKSAGNIQDTAKVAELCGTGTGSLTIAPTDGTANLASVSAFTDQRDNNTYAIAKLADGNCWMIENLRLDNTAKHNSDGTLAQGYGSSVLYGNFSGLADSESSNFSALTANSIYYIGNQSGDSTVNIGTSDGPALRMPRYNNLNTANRAQNNPISNIFENNSTVGGMYSYGNYYTWSAAIADVAYYSSGDNNFSSICPAGWKLPLGGVSSGEIEQGVNDSSNRVGGFSFLDRKMGGTGAYQGAIVSSLRWRKYPLNFVCSGYYSTSSASNRGSSGYYWSSTALNDVNSFYLGLTNTGITPGTNNYGKYGGSSIRCIFDL